MQRIRQSAIARLALTTVAKLADHAAVALDTLATRLYWAGRPEGVE